MGPIVLNPRLAYARLAWPTHPSTMKHVRLNTSSEWTPHNFERFVDIHLTLPYKCSACPEVKGCCTRHIQLMEVGLLWIDTPNLEHWTDFLTLFSKIPCVLHSKIEWHPLPKIVHLPHSATACGKMEQLELHTLHIHHVHACVCLGCACVCLCALIEQWLENRNTLWRSWDKGWCIARLVQCHGYESYGEIKDCEISQVIAKEVIQDGLVSALLTLNTCLH